MPHLVLEYSAQLEKEVDFKTLFSKLHQLVVAQIHTDLGNCKSRAYPTDHYLIGKGEDASFVHLEVRILEGRSDEMKHKLGEALKTLLVHELGAWVYITVELRDIIKAEYFKAIHPNA